MELEVPVALMTSGDLEEMSVTSVVSALFSVVDAVSVTRPLVSLQEISATKTITVRPKNLGSESRAFLLEENLIGFLSKQGTRISETGPLPGNLNPTQQD